jgi:hypothetical protein
MVAVILVRERRRSEQAPVCRRPETIKPKVREQTRVVRLPPSVIIDWRLFAWCEVAP